jgi:hypothetical protein
MPLLELEPDPTLPGGRRVRDLPIADGSDDVRLFAPPLRVA